jgi:very-short-patch-repair endonuclease
MNEGIQFTPEIQGESPRDVRVVLLDDEAEASWVAQSRSILRVGPGDESVSREWLRVWARSAEARRAGAAWAGRLLSCSPEFVLAVSPPLRRRYASLLERGGGAESPDGTTARACAEILGWSTATQWAACESWVNFVQIAPVADWPAVIMDGRTTLPEVMRACDELAVLGLPVGLVATPREWRAFLAGSHWSRAETRWRLAPVLGGGGVKPPVGPELPGEAARRFLRETAPETLPLLERAGSLITRDREKPEGVISGEARSAAEALLFSVLQSRPFTHGRFALNFASSFTFGTRPAEIDLAAAGVRLAVEIDGFFHFQNAEAYRRDRRKDALLQEHGWFVLRFLAEDIAGDLARVVGQIESTLARRDLAGAPAPSPSQH